VDVLGSFLLTECLGIRGVGIPGADSGEDNIIDGSIDSDIVSGDAENQGDIRQRLRQDVRWRSWWTAGESTGTHVVDIEARPHRDCPSNDVQSALLGAQFSGLSPSQVAGGEHEVMTVPGRVLYFKKESIMVDQTGGLFSESTRANQAGGPTVVNNVKKRIAYRPIWASANDFKRIIISSTMGSDHMPNALGTVLRKALESGDGIGRNTIIAPVITHTNK
jgi:hypothetical protein